MPTDFTNGSYSIFGQATFNINFMDLSDTAPPGNANHQIFVIMENGEGEKPRQRKWKNRRTAKACDQCRKKHRKCDGKSPCELCHKQSRICTYDQPRSWWWKAVFCFYLFEVGNPELMYIEFVNRIILISGLNHFFTLVIKFEVCTSETTYLLSTYYEPIFNPSISFVFYVEQYAFIYVYMYLSNPAL